MKILGVDIEPRWKWSREYAAHYRKLMNWKCVNLSEYGAETLSWQAIAERQAEKYARWLAEKNGQEIPEGCNADCQWHYDPDGRSKVAVERVRFYKPDDRDRPYERIFLLEIEVPHFDHVPAVRGETFDEDGNVIECHG